MRPRCCADRPLPSRADLVQITPEYLAYLRRWTLARSALLISDEVLSFRLGYTGAFGESSIKPDITAFGKIISLGFPPARESSEKVLKP
ncbi:aminotransferase class III-fold pyridoxal phosphate-dependent enzyme [Neorhizobium galegae]|uniref:aminotransferase class III-fold pyridoxal phosphate-dependent enzyme n=1 Tax=Neorhizobium galegae TaxID=399 RepID=UPI00155EF7E4